MGDRLPASSKSTDRGPSGASRSPWHPAGTLAFDNWSYPTDARSESSIQRPSYSSSSHKQPVPVGHEGQATVSQRPGGTRIPPAERTPRAPPPLQMHLAFRERPISSNINQQLERDGGRRNESPNAFLSRILSEPRPSPTERRQALTKERHVDREIERAEMSARLVSSRWQRGGDFTSQTDRASAAQRHGPAHVLSAGGQISSNPHHEQSSNNYIHPDRREIMTPVASGSRYSTADPVSESEDNGALPGPQSATSANTLPIQARKILPVPRIHPQPTTYPIPTYSKQGPAPGAKSLHSSGSRIPTGPCGTKRAQVYSETPLSKRSKTLEDIKRVEEDNRRLMLENKSIEIRIQMAKAERLRQEAVKKAAQELQLRALELKNAKLKQDNIELKLQLERNAQCSDEREGSVGRSVAKALAEGPTTARLHPNATKVDAQMKLQLGISAASDSSRPVQVLGGARLALEQMEVEIQSGEKNKHTAMMKARNSTRPEERDEDVEPGRPVKVEPAADGVAEAPSTLDYRGTQEVDIKMQDP